MATDTKNPVLRDLAGRLHRHHLGAITFARGVGSEEMHEILGLLAIEADRMDEPLGLDPKYRLATWEHVRFFPLTYERLHLVDEADAQAEETGQAESRTRRTRAAQLWIGLARAALASDTAQGAGDGTDEHQLADPTVIARAIDSHQRDAAYDQVIVGYMLQIADELKSGATPESGALKKRVSKMVSTLDGGTLERLVTMGGDRGQQRRFLLSANEGMTVDAVLDLVKAAGQTHEQNVSNSMLRMLEKLAQHAEKDRGTRKRLAESNVREQMASLITNWSLTDPNPDEYRQALQSMSKARAVFAVSPEQRFRPETRRMVQMALELDAWGEAVDRALEGVDDVADVPWMLELLRGAPASTTRDRLWRHVATPERLARFLEEPIDFSIVDPLVGQLRLDAADALLDRLAEAQGSQVRRQLIERIVGLGSPVGSVVLGRLADERWYVTRNALSILGDLETTPAGFDASDLVTHEDARVRREAMRILLRDPGSRNRAIALGLGDKDDRVVRLALVAAQQGCPDGVVPLVVARATEASESDHRLLAIRVLGSVTVPAAREGLLRLIEPRRGLLGVRPPPKTPEYLEALRAAQGFAADPRIRRALAIGARARDAEIVAAALGTEAGSA